MNPECIGCTTGSRLAAEANEYRDAFEHAESKVNAYLQKIEDCSPLDILIGARRRLKKEFKVFVDEELKPASKNYIMSIPGESRVERCAGPFDLNQIGLIYAAGTVACGTDIVGIRARYSPELTEDNTATDNSFPIIENS